MADTKEIKRKLYDKLKEYYPDKDFVCGVISNVKNDEDRQVLIDYIDFGEDVSVENIILYALDLNLKRKGDSEDEWEVLVKQTYLKYEEEPTYIKAYKWKDLYIAHGEISVYCFSNSYENKWTFSGRDIWVTKDDSEAISFFDDCMVLKDWLGYTYRVNCKGEEI